MPPLYTTPIALEAFDGTDTADILGRTPDGGGVGALAVGEWAYGFAGNDGFIGIDTNVGVVTYDTDYASYQLNSIPSLPSPHGARLRCRVFATANPGDLTINYTPVTSHDFTADSDTLDIDGLGLNGGPGTFRRIDGFYMGTSLPTDSPVAVDSSDPTPPAKAIVNAVGANEGGYYIDGLSNTKNHAVRLTGYFFGGAALFQAITRMVVPVATGFNVQGFAVSMDQGGMQILENTVPGSIGGLQGQSESIAANDSITIENAVITCPGEGTCRIVGKLNGTVETQVDPPGGPMIHTTNSLAGPGAGLEDDHGYPGFAMTRNCAITLIEVFEVEFSECPSGGDEFVQFEVALCQNLDSSDDYTHYGAYRAEGIYSWSSGDPNATLTVDLKAYHRIVFFGSGASGNTRLLPRYTTDWSPGIPIELWLEYEVSDDPTPVRILHVYLNGDEILTFNVLTDTPDQTGSTHLAHTAGSCPDYAGTGVPGLAAYDDAIFTLGAARQMLMDEYAVLIFGEEEPPCVPTGGGGGGGGGEDAPIPYFWVRRNLAFHRVPIPSPVVTSLRTRANLETRTAIGMKVRANLLTRDVGYPSIFVLDPDDGNPDSPICPDPGGVIDPLPSPAPFTGKVLSLYNMTKNLLDTYPPFNTAGTGSNPTDLPALLAALAARSMKLILIPAWRREQTLGGAGRAAYDHTANMAKINSWSGFTDPNIGVIAFLMVFDDLNCDICWNGRRPNNDEVNEACAAAASIFGVPAGVTTSPRILRSRGYDCAAVDIVGGAFGGRGFYGNTEGFGDDVDGWIAAQQDAATALGVSQIMPTINPYRDLASGWRTDVWTDAYLEEKGVALAGMSMGVGVNFWTGYPPSARLRTPGTNAAVSAIAAAL